MYCPNKLQLNKFVAVKCPKPKDIFARIGKREPLGTGANDGTHYSQVVDFNSSILDRFGRISKEDELRLYDEYQKSLSSETVDPSSVSSESVESTGE